VVAVTQGRAYLAMTRVADGRLVAVMPDDPLRQLIDACDVYGPIGRPEDGRSNEPGR
jgi:hypothetical protein